MHVSHFKLHNIHSAPALNQQDKDSSIATQNHKIQARDNMTNESSVSHWRLVSKERQIVGAIESAPRLEGTCSRWVCCTCVEGVRGIYKYIVGKVVQMRCVRHGNNPNQQAIQHLRRVGSVDQHILAGAPGHPTAWSFLTADAPRAC